MTDRLVGIHVSRRHLVIMLTVVIISSAFLVKIVAQEPPPYPFDHAERSLDTLAYVSEDYQLILYDPHDRTETLLLSNVRGFKLSRDGRVAYTRVEEDITDLYVFNPLTSTLEPVNITQTPNTNEYPLAWSPDGLYLAFGSYQEEGGKVLYVWDGETTVNIMPEDTLDAAAALYVNWSPDGRLAILVVHGWSSADVPNELYLWDGTSTVSVSQNPQGWDSDGQWSRDGQLMFHSQRDDDSGIYIWDGTSLMDGAPDVNSFIHLAPELEPHYPIWMDDGFVAFTTRTAASSGTKEIVVWDLESEAIIRRIPVASDNEWSALTGDGQMIISTHLASGIPSVYLDLEDTSGNILLSVHSGDFSWTSSGYLAYCGIEGGDSRVLSIWDGEETWVVARVSYRPIQWQNMGQIFSCNNG